MKKTIRWFIDHIEEMEDRICRIGMWQRKRFNKGIYIEISFIEVDV